MIDLSKPFRFHTEAVFSAFQISNTFNGVTYYATPDHSIFVLDILSKRGAAIRVKDGNVFIDGQRFSVNPQPPAYSYGVRIQDRLQYSEIPSDQEFTTPATQLNVNVPIIALKGTGNISVDAVVGPYLVNYVGR